MSDDAAGGAERPGGRDASAPAGAIAPLPIRPDFLDEMGGQRRQEEMEDGTLCPVHVGGASSSAAGSEDMALEDRERRRESEERERGGQRDD